MFHVFLKVDWFEAWRGPVQGNPARQVTRSGARVTDVPSRRGFFVIDRSRAIEQATGIEVLPHPIEDSNLNGALDPGEDLNGNGKLDRAYNFADAVRPFDVAPLILYERIIE